MIIRFTVENWMSFKNIVSLSFLPSRERQHRQRVAHSDNIGINMLPVACVYGGNASGKSNLYKAMAFCQSFIIKTLEPEAFIDIDPFCLDEESMDAPCSFGFDVLIEDQLYEYSFSLSRYKVISESLWVTKKSKRLLQFERKDQIIKFGKELKNNQQTAFIANSTRPNQLYLNACCYQNMDTFKPLFQWFQHSLFMISPKSKFLMHGALFSNAELKKKFEDSLRNLDTGIDKINFEEIPVESIHLPDEIKNRASSLSEKVTLVFNDKRNTYEVNRSQGKLRTKKLTTSHASMGGNLIKLELHQESDGTQRLIDLLPAFIELQNSSSGITFFIDELDRSLHTLLTRQLLESFLTHCTKDSRNQLIFTTHDVLLMDQDLFRRDEMWVTERNSQGISDLYSFGEFKEVRYDKDIRKSYLQGRLGGIPRFLVEGALSAQCSNEDNLG